MKASTKNPVKPEFTIRAGDKDSSCLCIYNREEQLPSRKIPLGEDEFYELWRRSIKPGALPLPDFIAAAIREKVAREAAPRFDKVELENATAANNALMQLLCENMEFQRTNSGASSFSGDGEAGTLCFGIFQLVQACRERLAAATAHTKPEVAS